MENMEKNKYTLITIIILLVILLPLTIYGTYTSVRINTNFNKAFKYNDKLWFYDGKKLIGTYDCKSLRCDYAKYANKTKSSMIKNAYAFIEDDGPIYLYNIKSGTVIREYDEVDIGTNSVFYVKEVTDSNDGKWGAIAITADIVNKVDTKYDQVKYLNGKFVVKDGENIMLLEDNEPIFTTNKDITDFNDNYVVVSSEIDSKKVYELYNYNNVLMFSNRSPLDKITFVDDYFLLKKYSNYYLFALDDGEERYIDSFFYEGTEEITYEVQEDKIEFFAGTESQKVIELNSEE